MIEKYSIPDVLSRQ